jgi:hypothetical protein
VERCKLRYFNSFEFFDHTGQNFFWTYVAGPIAALLPERWRRALPTTVCANWERAAALSGFIGFWYMWEMTRRIGQIMDASETGQIPVGLSEHQVQGAALTIFYMNPLTWILAYFFLEGAARLCGAAFTENEIVRVDEVYYRLEESTVESGARPFRYRLRRLEAGVTGRNVILYKSDDALVRE